MRILGIVLLIAVIGCGQAPPPQPKQSEKTPSVAEVKKLLAWQDDLDNNFRQNTVTAKGVQVSFGKLKADQDREEAVFLLMGKPDRVLSPGERLLAQRYFERKLIDLKIYIEQYELALKLTETPEQFEHYRQECQQRLQEWHQWEAEQTHLDIQKMKPAPPEGKQ